MKKRFFFAAMALLATTGAFAQGNGIGGITEATNMSLPISIREPN